MPNGQIQFTHCRGWFYLPLLAISPDAGILLSFFWFYGIPYHDEFMHGLLRPVGKDTFCF